MLIDLWRHISRRHRLELMFLLCLMVITSFTEIISIGALLPFLAAVTAPEKILAIEALAPLFKVLEIHQTFQLLVLVTTLFILAAIVSGSLKILLLRLQLRTSYAIGTELSLEIFRRSIYQPYPVHLKRNSSEIIVAVFEKANQVTGGVIVPTMTLLTALFTLIIIISALVALSPVVTLSTAICFLTVYTAIVLVTKNKLFSIGNEINLAKGQAIKTLQESLGGIRDIIIDGTQEIFCQTYRNIIVPLKRAEAAVNIFSATPRFVIEAISIIVMAAVTLVLVTAGGDTAAAIPILGTIAMGAQRVLPLFQQCYSSWTYIHSSQHALRDTLALLEQPIFVGDDSQSGSSIVFEKEIELKDVWFRHETSGSWIIKGVSFKFCRGSRIGVVGSTGSGKSTLLDIFMGLLEPSQGSLLIDGEPISYRNCRSWQDRIAHVPQSIFLTDATVSENIAFGIAPGQVDMDRVKWAARQAHIDIVIEALPAGYNTQLGERGARLSGGQRQRIGIARALYKRADILVFDEATSALDLSTEQSIMYTVDSLPREITVILVAHRLSTLNNCSQILELENGILKCVRSHQKIIE